MDLRTVVGALIDTALNDPLFKNVREKIKTDIDDAIDKSLKDIVVGDMDVAEQVGVNVLREKIYDNVKYCSLGFTVLGFVCRLLPGAEFNKKVFGDRTKTKPIDLNDIPTNVGPKPMIVTAEEDREKYLLGKKNSKKFIDFFK